MKNSLLKSKLIILCLALTLVLVCILSMANGEIKIGFNESIKALFYKSSEYFNSVIWGIRLPRILIGVCVGATLSLAGFLANISLKNSLADSGILGIQGGATVAAIIVLLLSPALIAFLPLFSFLGAMVAFLALVLMSFKKGKLRSNNIVLVGVAINAVCTCIIGIITITNANKVKDALSWLNGSLLNVSQNDMNVVIIYSIIIIIVVFLIVPVLKLLLLDDNSIINLGYNPTSMRLMAMSISVMLASITVAFVGIINFVGIISTQISKKIVVSNNIKLQLLCAALIGSILVVATDFLQRMVFSPVEIPVGILIGVLGAPLFIFLTKGD